MVERLSGTDDMAEPAQPGRRENVAFSDAFSVFSRNFALFGSCILFALVLAGLYLDFTPPKYRASAQLLLDSKPPQIFREATDINLGADRDQIETHMVALKARGIASGVVARLALVNDGEFRTRTSPTRKWIRDLFFWQSPEERAAPDPSSLAIDILQEKTLVQREGISQVINLSFVSEDPKKAALIVNEIVRTYIGSLLEVRANAAREASEWLEERLSQLRLQMNEAAERAKNFRADQESATLEELQLTADTYRKVYQSFYSAFTEAVQRESYPVSTLRVISEASAPRGRSSPKPSLVFGLAIVLGGAFGLLIAMFREGRRHRVSLQ